MMDDVTAFREASPMEDDELSRKLMDKISVQATQLTNLAKAFNASSEYIEICEKRIRELEEEAALHKLIDEGAAEHNLTEAALKRNDDRESSRRLEEVEQLLLASSNHISDLERDIRSKERQCKLNEKKVIDLGLEMQKMKVQIEQYQHASRLMSKPTECSANRKVLAGLKSEIDALKAYLNSYQTRLEASKKAERAMALKVGILEDERESQPQGAYADSQAKVLILTEKVRKLKSELRKQIDTEQQAKVNAVSTISTRSIGVIEHVEVSKSVPEPVGNYVRNDVEVENNPKSGVSSVTSSCSRGEKVAALERVIVSLKLKLDEAERERIRDKQKEAREEREEREAREERTERGERGSRESRDRVLGPESPTNTPSMKDLKEKLKTIEQERDVLLEFIQGDMKRSAEIAIMLKKEKDRVSHLQNDLNASLSKEKLLRVELESLIREIAGDKNDSNDGYSDGNNNEKRNVNDKNNENKKNIKIDASEGVKEGIKEDFIVSVLSSELRAAHAKVLNLEEKLEKLDQLAELKEFKELKESRELEASERGDSINSRVKDVDADFSMCRANSSTATTRSTKPPWRKPLSSDLESRRAVDDWQIERLTLIKELESIRPVDRALAELGTDLKKLRARDIEAGVYEDEIVSSPTRVPLKLTTVRSYSNMYSQSQSSHAKGQGQASARSDGSATSSSKPRAQTPIKPHPTMANLNSLNRSTDNPTDNSAYNKADNVRNSVGDTNSDEIRRSDNRPHGSLSKQHSWVTLPSIPRLSSLLHERINRLFNDLHKCESKYFDAEESNQQIRSELARAAVENEREIQRLTATTTAAQDALIACRKQLQQSLTNLKTEREQKNAEQRAERVAVRVMEQTADALCDVPGGWEQYFDSKTPDFSLPVKNSRRDRGDRGEGREGGEGRDREEDYRGRGEEGDGSLLRPPPSMVPVIVKRAVSMTLSSSSELRSVQRDLVQASDNLCSSQNLFRQVREENKKLSKYTDILLQKEADKERSFMRIESSVRRDLDRERALSKEQQLLVVNLKMKVRITNYIASHTNIAVLIVTPDSIRLIYYVNKYSPLVL